MTTVHVERATLEDMKAIWEIYEEPGQYPDRRAWLMDCVHSRRVVVAKVGWEVYGFAAYQPSFFEYSLVRVIIVRQAHQRQGIGTRLMGYTELTTKQDRIFAHCTQQNTVAQCFYAALGYKTCGEIQHVNANGQPESIFIKRLDGWPSP